MNNESQEKKVSSLAQMLGLGRVESIPLSLATLDGILNAECALVKADNLAALCALNRQDEFKIDFCYIDPPYNTGSTFVYDDKRRINRGGLWGRHEDWMTFMLPRLTLAHGLLRNDGIIAISIDDYEYAHLKILMDAVFDEENYIATLIVCRSKNGKGGKANVAVNHEYVLVYGKTSESLLHGIAESDTEKYDREDEHGQFTIDGLFRKKGDASLREDRPNLYYPLYYAQDGSVYADKINDHLHEVFPMDSKGVERRWLWGREKAKAESWKLYASKGGVIYVKNYNSDSKRIKIRSIFDKLGYLTDRATTEIKEIYGDKVFETPKPLELIKDLIECCCAKNAVILDFFAGTGTTAHAAYELNRTTNAYRKTILVEHPHPVSSTHMAGKNGFETTADITEFRLKKIRKDDPSFVYSLHGIVS
jgi:adenine-specific DNA-methyltransferase